MCLAMIWSSATFNATAFPSHSTPCQLLCTSHISSLAFLPHLPLPPPKFPCAFLDCMSRAQALEAQAGTNNGINSIPTLKSFDLGTFLAALLSCYFQLFGHHVIALLSLLWDSSPWPCLPLQTLRNAKNCVAISLKSAA
jgi:hypothetical protein